MLKNQYISLILFLIILVTLVNLYYKPYLVDADPPFHWIKNILNPISKSACTIMGVKCPTDELCDCETMCSNGREFVPFKIIDETVRIYIMNQKLSPGTYCLPKGVDKCNLKTSYHIFSIAGWSCISINDDIFKNSKKKACKNEEAKDNSLNVLWDYRENKEAGDDIEDYYESLPNKKLRYRCKCNSKALDDTRMISIFPFICSVDYCLRDIPNPLKFMGWDGNECVCGSYFHLLPNDKTSPCRRNISRIENVKLKGKVDCMTNKSFVKETLLCPTDDDEVFFNEYIFEGNEPTQFVEQLLQKHLLT